MTLRHATPLPGALSSTVCMLNVNNGECNYDLKLKELLTQFKPSLCCLIGWWRLAWQRQWKMYNSGSKCLLGGHATLCMRAAVKSLKLEGEEWYKTFDMRWTKGFEPAAKTSSLGWTKTLGREEQRRNLFIET